MVLDWCRRIEKNRETFRIFFFRRCWKVKKFFSFCRIYSILNPPNILSIQILDFSGLKQIILSFAISIIILKFIFVKQWLINLTRARARIRVRVYIRIRNRINLINIRTKLNKITYLVLDYKKIVIKKWAQGSLVFSHRWMVIKRYFLLF